MQMDLIFPMDLNSNKIILLKEGNNFGITYAC